MGVWAADGATRGEGVLLIVGARAKRDLAGGVERIVDVASRVVRVMKRHRRLNACHEDVVGPAAARRACEVLASRVRCVDNWAARTGLDSARRTAVDHLEVDAVGSLAARDDGVAAETFIVGTVVLVAVAGERSTGYLCITEGREIVLVVGRDVRAHVANALSRCACRGVANDSSDCDTLHFII